MATLRLGRPTLSKRRKGGFALNLSDVLLALVDRLIAEKEENFMLRLQQIQQSEQTRKEKQTKPM